MNLHLLNIFDNPAVLYSDTFRIILVLYYYTILYGCIISFFKSPYVINHPVHPFCDKGTLTSDVRPIESKKIVQSQVNTGEQINNTCIAFTPGDYIHSIIEDKIIDYKTVKMYFKHT